MFHLQCDLGSPRSVHLSAVAPEDVWLLQSKKFSIWTTLFLLWSTCVGGNWKAVRCCSCHAFCIGCGMARCIPIPNTCHFVPLCLMNKMQTTFENQKKKKKRQAFYKNHRGCMSCLSLTLWELRKIHLCQTRIVSKLIRTWQGSCWLAGGGFIFSPFI